MKIIVTGSNGIIGKQIIINLKIIYPDCEIFELNRSSVINTKNCIYCDILKISYEEISRLFNKIKPDLIFHLAWYTNHEDYLNSDLNNLWELATINLINAFYNSGGDKFIGIGSSIEYNWKGINPFNEKSSDLNGNDWKYGQAKVNVYKYLESLDGISFQWDRVFFVFGPGQSRTRLIPLIIENALNGGSPLKVNLNLKRDYISTFEIAKQISMMSICNHIGSVNICSGISPSIKDLILLIESITNRSVTISKEKYSDSFEIEEISGSIDVIHKFYPNYSYDYNSLKNDLVETIKYYNLK